MKTNFLKHLTALVFLFCVAVSARAEYKEYATHITTLSNGQSCTGLYIYGDNQGYDLTGADVTKILQELHIDKDSEYPEYVHVGGFRTIKKHALYALGERHVKDLSLVQNHIYEEEIINSPVEYLRITFVNTQEGSMISKNTFNACKQSLKSLYVSNIWNLFDSETNRPPVGLFSDFTNLTNVEWHGFIPKLTFCGAPVKNLKYYLDPSSNGISGTHIKECAFMGCPLESISIEGQTIIAKNAFGYGSETNGSFTHNIPTLTHVTIGYGIRIDENVNSYENASTNLFENCQNLKTVCVENGELKHFPINMFANCNSLTQLRINAPAFARCYYTTSSNAEIPFTPDECITKFIPNVQSVVFGPNVKYVGKYAFYGCETLTSVDVESSVTDFDNCAFILCPNCPDKYTPFHLFRAHNPNTNTESLTLDEGILCGPRATNGWCESQHLNLYYPDLKYVTFDSSVESIPAYLFSSSAKVEKIVFETKSFSIDDGAFKGLTSLKKVECSNDVEVRGGAEEIFADCSNLETVGSLFRNSIQIYDRTFKNCSKLSSIVHGPLIYIGKEAFYNCSRLSDVDKNSQQCVNPYIGESAFENCSALKSAATIIGSCKDIKARAFKNCAALSNIDLSSCKTLGDYAFSGCKSLTSITLPASLVSSPNATVFAECPSLKEVTSKRMWTDWTKEHNMHLSFPALQTFHFDYEAKAVPDYMFYGCNSLSQVTFSPNASLVSVGEYAFYGCALTYFEFAGLKRIGQMAFAYNDIATVELPTSLESISANAFKSEAGHGVKKLTIPNNLLFDQNTMTEAENLSTIMPSLEDVVLLANVTEVPDHAFNGCTLLTNVTINSKSLAAKSYPTISNSINLADKFPYLTNLTFGPEVDEVGNLCFCVADDETYPLASVSFATPAAIGRSAFANNHALSTINGSVKSVYEYSFSKTNISSITITDDDAIDRQAFEECASLENVSLPSNLTEVGNQAFKGCSSLKNVVFPTTLTTIGYYAFEGCSSLDNVGIPENVTYIDGGAFYQAKSLKNLTINSPSIANPSTPYTTESNLKTIFPYVENLNFGNSVTSIGAYAVYRNIFLKTVHLPSSVTEIGASAFRNCPQLSSIKLPNGITHIAENTFSTCVGLTEAYLPYDLEVIGENAFSGCSSLTRVNMPSVVTIGQDAFKNCTSLEWIELPENLASVDLSAFATCSNLKTVSINGNAFANANWTRDHNIHDHFPSADYFNFGSAVTAVHDYAFYVAEDETSPLRRLYFRAAASIGDGAFGNNRNLTQLDGGVGSVGNAAFGNCSQLSSILIRRGPVDVDAFKNCSSLKSVTLPDDLTTISLNTFFGCSSLEKIDIPAGVTSINPLAFYGCSALTEVEIPAGVTSIGSSAFSGCTSLAEVEIPTSVTNIGNYVFNDCTALAEVIIPDGVKSIEQSTFNGCTSLAKVEIPAGVTSIGTSAFKGCTSLAEVEIPAEVTSIEESTFEGCSSLAEVEIPAMVTSIGKSAFKDCTALAKVEIPAGVKSIGNFAFRKCTSLNNVICHVEEPIEINFSSFYQSSYTTAQLFVPYESISNYKTATIWKDFGEILPIGIRELENGVTYDQEEAIEVSMVRFNRTFKDTEVNTWQSIYLPFSVDVTKHPELEFAEIFSISPISDTNGDGYIDPTDKNYMIVSRLKSGYTKANVPYVVRPKQSGLISIAEENALLCPSDDNHQVRFSNSRTEYTITGVYEPFTFYKGDNYYYVSTANGNILSPTQSATVRAYKWVLHIENKEYGEDISTDTESLSSPMRIIAIGEDITESTAIHLINGDYDSLNTKNDAVYRLDGTRTFDKYANGVIIKNGKKILTNK